MIDRPTTPDAASCEGCGAGLTPMEALRWRVCLPCTKARHRAAASRGRCCCGPRKRRPGDVCRTGSRSWIPCRRCLGTIEQLS